MQTWIAYIKKTWIAYIKLKKHITNPIKMFMNFAKTVYLSNIKEKSYIQIKKSTDWMHHWFVWIYSNSKHQARIKLVERNARSSDQKNCCLKNIRQNLTILKHLYFLMVYPDLWYIYTNKTRSIYLFFKSYFHADINCLYQTEKRHN